MANNETKGKTNKILGLVFVIVFVAVVGLIVLLVLLNSKEDYYSDKYAEDYKWYLGACTEAFDTIYESGTLLFCDCGYHEFRNKYGDKKIYGKLSVTDVLGIGGATKSLTPNKTEYISDEELTDNIKACYDSELKLYKETHSDVDVDGMWADGERLIVPRRLLSEENK